jgi:UDP-N-acetylmuramate dehydrogenase
MSSSSDGQRGQAMLAAAREVAGARARTHEPLARHSTFGVGGPAEVWVTIEREDELTHLVASAQAHGWPLMLVGNGTNVLFADAGAQGIVARLALVEWHLRELDAETARLVAGAGVSLPKLVNDLAERGWAGLEWGAGVPGTIGGGVVSNAGAHDGCIADTLQTARVFFTADAAAPDGGVRELESKELELAYRHSRFRAARRVTFAADGHPSAPPRVALIEPAEIITSATFLLRHADPAVLRQRVDDYKRHRKETQPPQKSAGSVFKNPPGDYAARLIEAAGLKGQSLGRAQISPRHANFIVNAGGATAAEVTALIALAQRTVRERFSVELELEVELRGDW